MMFPHRFHVRDLLGLLGLPVYIILHAMIHEYSHAIAAWLEGATVTRVVFYPTWNNGLRFSAGAWWAGQTTCVTTVAPYLIDITMMTIGLILLSSYRLKFHLPWVLLVYVFVVAPFGDVIVNYLLGILASFGWRPFIASPDVLELFRLVPSWIVHGAFIVVIALYGLLFWYVLRGHLPLRRQLTIRWT